MQGLPAYMVEFVRTMVAAIYTSLEEAEAKVATLAEALAEVDLTHNGEPSSGDSNRAIVALSANLTQEVKEARAKYCQQFLDVLKESLREMRKNGITYRDVDGWEAALNWMDDEELAEHMIIEATIADEYQQHLDDFAARFGFKRAKTTA